MVEADELESDQVLGRGRERKMRKGRVEEYTT